MQRLPRVLKGIRIPRSLFSKRRNITRSYVYEFTLGLDLLCATVLLTTVEGSGMFMVLVAMGYTFFPKVLR